MTSQVKPHQVSGANWKINQLLCVGQPTKTFELGNTELPEEMFRDMIVGLCEQFTADKFDMNTNNCNHFTSSALEILIGRGLPDDI